MTVAEQLGTALRTVRQSVGVSQGALSDRIGKKQSYISEYETGRKPLPLRLVADIEQALGVSRGTILVAAGFVDHDVTVRDLLVSDPALDAEDRRLLLEMYERARLWRSQSDVDGVADHS